MAVNLNLADQIKKVEERIDYREQILSKGLMQPFNNTNSGSRKIMFGTHREHVLSLMNPEVPIIQTGYENEFGHKSSSFIIADSYYDVLAKIPKFANKPEDHYYLIVLNNMTNQMSVIERVGYNHITESYGYLFNNDFLDTLEVGSCIERGSVIRKSTSYDEYDNRMDGVNLLTAYISSDDTMEDGICISESARDKLVSPLIKRVSIIINDNDIPLNIYGDNNIYKTFPDVGEHIKDGILCALRREKKEESLFTQSYSRLQDIMMSDEKYTLDGKVIDINIYCNNPENLQGSYYNQQLKYYYDDYMRFCKEFTDAVNENLQYFDNSYMDYDLQKLYYNCKDILNGKQFMKDRPFSNIIMDIIVLEENKINVGDKLSDRYGGKGVVSKILPDHLMPNVNGNTVEIIFNKSTCVNRLNPGQLFETSCTHVGKRIIDFINTGTVDMAEAFLMIMDYIRYLNPEQAEAMEDYMEYMDDNCMEAFVNSVCNEDGIFMSLKPISDSLTLDKLDGLYKIFPWASQYTLEVPIVSSTGEVRYVPSRRPIIAGKKYIYRLKQYAEEKFSVTSLSATNIRNENTRSKVNKAYKGLFTKTPVRFGEMESTDMMHVGAENVIINLMIHSASPHARRLTEQMLTGDPFNIDIKLDTDSRNRNVEILNAYFKTMGLRLVFEKVYKHKTKPISYEVIRYEDGKRSIRPVHYVGETVNPIMYCPIEYDK